MIIWKKMKTVKIEPSKKMMKYFQLAKTMAVKSDSKWKHGAVLVSGGTIINTATNLNRPCSFGVQFRKKEMGQATAHAELAVILNMPKQSTNHADIYVVRINSNYEWRQSLCCDMCFNACKFVGIKRIYFSTNDGFEMVKLR